MDIKMILESLTTSQRAQLMTAFNHHFSQCIPLGDMFIGVHLVENPKLLVTETAGCWSYGKILKN